MAKKKTGETEIQALRSESAKFQGFIARLHGHLGLGACSGFSEQFNACCVWLGNEVLLVQQAEEEVERNDPF